MKTLMKNGLKKTYRNDGTNIATEEPLLDIKLIKWALNYQINLIQIFEIDKVEGVITEICNFLYDEICRIRIFQSHTGSNFSINLVRFKPTKLKRVFKLHSTFNISILSDLSDNATGCSLSDKSDRENESD